MYLNLPGVLAGVVLTMIGLHLIRIALNYCRNIQGPGKNLAKNFLISVSIFTVGLIGAVIDSITETKLWFIMPVLYPSPTCFWLPQSDFT
ncbi:hypothetical protein DRO69_06480 [Candidatus Bathyarchaeota archaeon]|nr:MAG: hypothetical protein DRO69_06480 [Candidatus Bathyarchaeota archaeon]